MKKTNINSKKGFTIIEVILVLAIGSLIILMALVALPSLQSSQRDSQRKTDYSMLETAITNYASNNRGELPKDDSFVTTYIKDSWADPSAGSYTVNIKEGSETLCKYGKTDASAADGKTDASAADGKTDASAADEETDALEEGDINIYTGCKCNGDKPAYDNKLGKRRYAIYAYLESGTYCQAN